VAVEAESCAGAGAGADVQTNALPPLPPSCSPTTETTSADEAP
jgi:hypothetical protein